MWNSQPNFTTKTLKQITVPIWIVAGDHNRSDTEYMARIIPHARLLIERNVGHFSFLHDPKQFNHDVLYFLN